jgi:type IV secretion system protein VirB5
MSLFKKKQDLEEKPKKPSSDSANYNPYIAARREWVERYASFEQSADRWRFVALTSLIIAAVAVGFVGYMGTQSKLVPYVVEVDKTGNAIMTGFAEKMKPIDERVTRGQLRQFVNGMYTSITDKEYQYRLIDQTYAMVTANSIASKKIIEFFTKRKPLLMTENVRVVVESVSQQSTLTYQMDFTEEYRDSKGFLDRKVRHRMVVTVQYTTPVGDAVIKNPTGLEVIDFDVQDI